MKRNKGINLDSSHIDQPKGTTRYVKNAILERDLGDIRNEGGTSLDATFRGDKRIIGSILLPDNSKVLFIAGINLITQEPFGEIFIQNSLNEVTGIVTNNSILDFRYSNGIKGTYVINSKNEIIVVWVDNLHKIRKYNITENPGITKESDISLIPLVETFTNITVNSINNTGGILETGVYYISVALKNDQGSISTNFTEIVGPIYITDDSYIGNVDTYDGSNGGIATSKSISITINDIDTNYNRISVAVMSFQNGVLLPTKVLEAPVSGSTLDLNITGAGYIDETSIEDVIIDNILYNKAKTLSQVDSQIYFGNLTAEELNLQPVVNSIITEFITAGGIVRDDNSDTGYKSPMSHLQLRTFQRDEVYAFYASFVLVNGGETKLFHIPGRLPIETPVEGVFETDPVSDLNFVGSPYEQEAQSILAFDPNARIFQYFNFLDGNNTSYWENESEVYPTGIEWGALQNTPIRHHRVPDAENRVINRFPVQNAANIIGVKFKNINIPLELQDKILGVKFYAAKRTGNNSLVVSSMLSGSFYSRDLFSETETLHSNPLWIQRVLRTDDTARRDLIGGKPFDILNGDRNVKSGSYIKNFSLINQTNSLYDETLFSTDQDNRGVFKDFTQTSWLSMVNKEDKYRGIIESDLLQFDTEKRTEQIFYGRWAFYLTIDQETYAPCETRIVLKLNEQINEPYVENNINDINPSKTFLTYIYTGFKTLYNSFSNQEVFYLGSTNTEETLNLFKGDCVISKYTFKDFNIDVQGGSYPFPLPPDGIGFKLYMLITTYTESSLNINLREEGTLDEELYYPKTSNISKFLPTIASLPGIYTEYIKVNTDFSRQNDLKQGEIFSRQQTTEGKLSTRIIRSLKYDGVNENYRILLPDNFLDLQRNRGELIDVNAVNNIIVAHLERALVITKGKEELQINDLSTAYLGSGDLFAAKPDEVIMTEEGYAGNQNMFASLVFPGGYFFVDMKARKVYVFAQQLSEISAKGLAQWFETNLRNNLNKYGFIFPETPNDSFGLLSGYDSFNKRILLTKKDVIPTAELTSLYVSIPPNAPTGNYTFFDAETQLFYRFDFETFVTTSIAYTDTKYFTPDNWTLSFSVETGNWISFHDYFPNLYIKDLNSMKSANLEKIWSHDILTNMGIFYNERKDFILEFVDHQNGETFYTPSFDLRTSCFNQEGGKELFETFTTFHVYNSFQLSEEINIEHLDTARALRDTWIVNKFRDMKSNPGVRIVNNDFSINTLDINLNTPWYQQRRFIDNYVVVRLIFNNTSNNLLILHSANANLKTSYR
jgi:hypothetical protein